MITLIRRQILLAFFSVGVFLCCSEVANLESATEALDRDSKVTVKQPESMSDADPTSRLDTLKFLCRFCDSVACMELAEILSEEKQNPAEEEHWLAKARHCAHSECKSGRTSACLVLHELYRDGKGGDGDAQKSLFFRNRVLLLAYDECLKGICNQCEILGALLDDANELMYANQFYAMACSCSGKLKFSCTIIDARGLPRGSYFESF